MKKELFKEINAHARAQDTKSFALVVAYATASAYLTSKNSLHEELSNMMAAYGLDKEYAGAFFLALAILSGYLVFHTSLWYRSWKVEYFNLCNKLWHDNKSDFGDHVPPWMKRETKLTSFDLIPRSLPIFLTSTQLFQLMRLMNANTIVLILIFGFHCFLLFVIYLHIRDSELKA